MPLPAAGWLFTFRYGWVTARNKPSGNRREWRRKTEVGPGRARTKTPSSNGTRLDWGASNVPTLPSYDQRSRALLMLAAAAFVTISGGCGNDADGRPAEWPYISPILFQPNCATTSCHSRAEAAAGLDFSDPGRGYESLFQLEVWIVDRAATPGQGGCKSAQGTVVCPRGTRPLIIPYNPAQSRVVQMLRARGAARMPPDRPLPEVDIRLIERWILNGASFRPSLGTPDAATPDARPDAGGDARDGGDTGDGGDTSPGDARDGGQG
jgi:hypothetical protein